MVIAKHPSWKNHLRTDGLVSSTFNLYDLRKTTNATKKRHFSSQQGRMEEITKRRGKSHCDVTYENFDQKQMSSAYHCRGHAQTQSEVAGRNVPLNLLRAGTTPQQKQHCNSLRHFGSPNHPPCIIVTPPSIVPCSVIPETTTTTLLSQDTPKIPQFIRPCSPECDNDHQTSSSPKLDSCSRENGPEKMPVESDGRVPSPSAPDSCRDFKRSAKFQKTITPEVGKKQPTIAPQSGETQQQYYLKHIKHPRKRKLMSAVYHNDLDTKKVCSSLEERSLSR